MILTVTVVLEFFVMAQSGQVFSLPTRMENIYHDSIVASRRLVLD